jgi:hypothetical protein
VYIWTVSSWVSDSFFFFGGGLRNEILRSTTAGTFLTKLETVAVSEVALIDVFSRS